MFDDEPSAQSDQYSLAIVYQEMLVGTLPFPGRTAAQLAKQHTQAEPQLHVAAGRRSADGGQGAGQEAGRIGFRRAGRSSTRSAARAGVGRAGRDAPRPTPPTPVRSAPPDDTKPPPSLHDAPPGTAARRWTSSTSKPRVRCAAQAATPQRRSSHSCRKSRRTFAVPQVNEAFGASSRRCTSRWAAWEFKCSAASER